MAECGGRDFVTQATHFVDSVLPSHGFEPLAFTRLPYISAGDAFSSYLALESVVVLVQRSKQFSPPKVSSAGRRVVKRDVRGRSFGKVVQLVGR